MRQQLFDVVINGHQTTLLLNDEQARFRGLDPADGRPVGSKARRASNKAVAAAANKAAAATDPKPAG